MKKFFKEILLLIVAVFIVTNIISFLRAPKLKIDTIKYFPKNTQIVYFYTKWCRVCKMEKPAIDKVSKSLKVVSVDAEEKKELANIFKVKGYPTIFYIKNGKVLYADMGYTSAFMIKLKSTTLSLF